MARMHEDDIVLLTRMGSKKNENGFTEEEISKENVVFGSVESVKRSEYYAAETAGHKATISVTVHPDDFEEAKSMEGSKVIAPSKLRVGGVEYRIVRTYQKNDMELEIIGEEG